MHSFFLIGWALAVAVALLPIALFLVFGWRAREAEFIDKIRDQTPNIEVYFDKFWSDGRTKYRAQHPTAEDSALFRARYRQLIGRRYYVMPCVLFALVVSVLTGLVVASAIRTGYDHYIEYFADVAKTEADAAKTGVIGNPITLQRARTADLDADFAPLPQIHLSLSALSAIAGAYLFIVAGLIRQCRARSLVYSDLFSASLRLSVAVPLGLSVSTLASDALGPLISFGLGAFPIVELRALIRRLTATSLKAGDPRADDDQTVAMVGVTQPVSDVLAEENITCAQQLADIDPVMLALRTGLSFDYVLFLAAQSLVWCFLGKTASALGPIGLADARAIWYLMTKKTEDDRSEVLASVDALFAAAATPQAPKSIDTTLLRLAFEKIAIEPYTRFLVDCTSDLDKPECRASALELKQPGSNGTTSSEPPHSATPKDKGLVPQLV
jgi:hypothetical protein